eukprot:s1474_g2.t1
MKPPLVASLHSFFAHDSDVPGEQAWKAFSHAFTDPSPNGNLKPSHTSAVFSDIPLFTLFGVAAVLGLVALGSTAASWRDRTCPASFALYVNLMICVQGFINYSSVILCAYPLCMTLGTTNAASMSGFFIGVYMTAYRCLLDDLKHEVVVVGQTFLSASWRAWLVKVAWEGSDTDGNSWIYFLMAARVLQGFGHGMNDQVMKCCIVKLSPVVDRPIHSLNKFVANTAGIGSGPILVAVVFFFFRRPHEEALSAGGSQISIITANLQCWTTAAVFAATALLFPEMKDGRCSSDARSISIFWHFVVVPDDDGKAVPARGHGAVVLAVCILMDALRAFIVSGGELYTALGILAAVLLGAATQPQGILAADSVIFPTTYLAGALNMGILNSNVFPDGSFLDANNVMLINGLISNGVGRFGGPVFSRSLIADLGMIDAFYIFTKRGLLLWSTQLVKVKGNPLDRLIKEVLLEERVGETFANVDAYNLKWKLLNEMDLFFVVVYQGILQMAYLEGLLAMVAKEFVQHVSNSFGNGLTIKHVDFDQEELVVQDLKGGDLELGQLEQILLRDLCPAADMELKDSRRPGGMRSFADTKKGAEVQKTREEKGLPPTLSASKKGKSGGADDEDDADAAKVAEARAKLGAKPKAKKEAEPASAEKPKKGKEARHWDGGKELDFSKNKPDNDADLAAKQAEFLGSDDENFDAEVESIKSSSGSEDEGKEDGPSWDSEGRVGGLFKSLTRGVKNITGGAVLGEEDLEPILKKFKTELMTRNVAAEVADKLADSVRRSLVGKTTGRFTSMASTVKQALKESMETLLTPKKSIDVLRAALAAKNAGRVYTIVFLGVNGVGKSTNLAKVAYYLKHKGGLNVLICACDTFRAGAVEQLKTHSRCLDVPLFERGYGKDPADIAKNAIAHAKANGHDVVLVDTAGRMQDNEPLMRALAKLVAINSPDLVLFVGEALVGNDAIDQVTKFNRMQMEDLNPRGIDGMLLTKYDTVDDKVGAALSMVYVTGQPVVFVGTGQKYTHLRKMQAKEVVKTLLG